jgi:hypothetical protein
MNTTFLEDDVGAVLSAAFSEVDGEVYVVNPIGDSISDLVFRLHGLDDPPTVRLLAAKDPLKAAVADFIVAGHTADLVAAETLSIRVLGETPKASLVVADDTVVSLVEGGDSVGGLTATDEAFVTEVRDRYERSWAASDEFTLRTPPLSRVRETLATDLGEGTAADFDAVLDSLSVAKGDGEGIDEVTITLLVAARNGELLYDVSKWGEDVGLASKATFSRKKTQLEDSGLIDTEKVPIDVGRPRLRLRLGDDELAAADPADLAGLVGERLAAERDR